MQVELEVVTEDTLYILKNMFTVYFSELSAWDKFVEFNEHGLPVWTAFDLPQPRTHEECADYNWWIRGSCELLLITADCRPAGFVIINTGPGELPPGIDFDLLDFFIAHKYRRQGIGREAARRTFERHRGRWEVAELTGNIAAIEFWNQVVGDYTSGRYLHLDDGTRQQFEN